MINDRQESGAVGYGIACELVILSLIGFIEAAINALSDKNVMMRAKVTEALRFLLISEHVFPFSTFTALFCSSLAAPFGSALDYLAADTRQKLIGWLSVCPIIDFHITFRLAEYIG